MHIALKRDLLQQKKKKIEKSNYNNKNKQFHRLLLFPSSAKHWKIEKIYGKILIAFACYDRALVHHLLRVASSFFRVN